MNKSEYSSMNNAVKLGLGFIYIIVAILLVYLTKTLDTSSKDYWYRNFSVMCIIQIAIQLFVMNRFGIKLFSISGMFIIFTYLYCYGVTFTLGIFNNKEFEFYYFFRSARFDFMSYVGASEMCYVGIMTTFAGMILYDMVSKGKMTFTDKLWSLEECGLLGRNILIFTLPFKLYSDMTKLRASFRGNYLDIFATGTSGYVGMIGMFAFIGIVLLIIANRANKRKAMKIYMMSVLYCLINMLSGDRGHWLIMICLLSYFLYQYVYKLSLGRLLIICLAFVMGVTFLNTIKHVRRQHGKTLQKYANQFVVELTEYNPLITLMSELGNTIRTPYLCYDQMPSLTEFKHGKTYVQSMVSILPNISKKIKKINKEAKFTSHLADNHAVGGSYIAEAYYNFSYAFWIITMIIGLFVGMLSRKLELYIIYNQYIKIAYILPILIYILWLPRDSIYSIIRPAFYGFIFVEIMSSYVRQKSQEKALKRKQLLKS